VPETRRRTRVRGGGLSAKKGVAPIIIIHKKADHHDDEHGGAWKVAYADFVTAMMALFIVLWLLSASEKVQKAVGGYFQDPTGKGHQAGSTSAGVGETLTLSQKELKEIKEKIEQAMKAIPAFKNMQNQIKMTMTAEGLRIDLMETEHGLFFDAGNPTPTEAGGALLKVLATELMKLPNKIAIEGHTDSTPYGRPDYSNWELSADRANAARRILTQSGLDDARISQVRGFADQRLLLKDDPTNPSNRRISIIVRNEGMDAQEEKLADSPAPAAAAPAAKPEKASAVMLPPSAPAKK
jgi:chemotaxis protein MotB